MIEEEMMTIGFNYLMNQNQFKAVKQEVPFLSRCIDIVLIDNSDVIISIEFKVKNWRHAIEQAVNHKLGADMSYICLPKRKISDVLRKSLEESGVGLLIFDKNSEEIITKAVSAASNSSNILAFRQMLKDNFEKV